MNEQPVPRPPVKRRCKRCETTLWAACPWAFGIVSPTGLEHIGTDGGETACGIDATGDKWWWPL